MDPGTGSRLRYSVEGQHSSWLEQKEDRLKQEEASRVGPPETIKEGTGVGAPEPEGAARPRPRRLARFEELSSYEYQKRNETQEIFIPVGERLGNEVIEFNNVSKAYGDRLLIDNLSFKIPPGAIVGIIGANGAGKSTLFRMIAGREQPDSGEVKIGQTVKLAYVDQSRDALEDKKTVFDAVADGADLLTVGKFEMSSRAYLGRFNFKGGDQNRSWASCPAANAAPAHGQDADRRRQRCCCWTNRPTTWTSKRCARWKTLLGSRQRHGHQPRSLVPGPHRHAHPGVRGDSQVVFFDGNYQEYEADKKRRLGDEAPSPSACGTRR